MYMLYSWVIKRGGYKAFTKKSMWKDARPFIDNYVEDHVQAPYILSRNYEKYLKDYEEFYNDGFGSTEQARYIGNNFYGAPIGKPLTNAIVLINAKKYDFPVKNDPNEEQTIQTRVDELIESMNVDAIFSHIDQDESKDEKGKPYRKAIFFDKCNLRPPLHYSSPMGTFVKECLNKENSKSMADLLKDVSQKWDNLDLKTRKTYEDLATIKNQKYFKDKCIYDKCVKILDEKYHSKYGKLDADGKMEVESTAALIVSTSTTSTTSTTTTTTTSSTTPITTTTDTSVAESIQNKNTENNNNNESKTMEDVSESIVDENKDEMDMTMMKG